MQCYSHWHMTLDPGMIKRRFTDSEDQIVLGLDFEKSKPLLNEFSSNH